jgi:hypothetical protein
MIMSCTSVQSWTRLKQCCIFSSSEIKALDQIIVVYRNYRALFETYLDKRPPPLNPTIMLIRESSTKHKDGQDTHNEIVINSSLTISSNEEIFILTLRNVHRNIKRTLHVEPMGKLSGGEPELSSSGRKLERFCGKRKLLYEL